MKPYNLSVFPIDSTAHLSPMPYQWLPSVLSVPHWETSLPVSPDIPFAIHSAIFRVQNRLPCGIVLWYPDCHVFLYICTTLRNTFSMYSLTTSSNFESHTLWLRQRAFLTLYCVKQLIFDCPNTESLWQTNPLMNDFPVPVGWIIAALPVSPSIFRAETYASALCWNNVIAIPDFFCALTKSIFDHEKIHTYNYSYTYYTP